MALAVGFASGTPTPYIVHPHRTSVSSLFNGPSDLPPSNPEAARKLMYNGRVRGDFSNPNATILLSASPAQLSKLQISPESFRQASYGRKPILPQPPVEKYKRAGVLPPKGYDTVRLRTQKPQYGLNGKNPVDFFIVHSLLQRPSFLCTMPALGIVFEYLMKSCSLSNGIQHTGLRAFL